MKEMDDLSLDRYQANALAIAVARKSARNKGRQSVTNNLGIYDYSIIYIQGM